MASAPALIVLAALAGWDILPVAPALTAGAATLAATGFIVGRWVSALQTLRGAVEALAQDGGATASAAPHIGPMVGELWLAIIRLRRVMRDQIRTAEGRLAAAEAVIAAVPDPLILLDDRRRIVRANAQAV